MCLLTKNLRATKQNWVQFFTLKALAAHPLLCYRFSMTSTVVNLLKLVLNDEQIILHWNQIVWHRSFWTDLMLGSQAKFWACAWPKMAVCLQSLLHTAILRLFQTFIFRRKLPNLLIELWEIFYHSYLLNKGLILPDLKLN